MRVPEGATTATEQDTCVLGGEEAMRRIPWLQAFFVPARVLRRPRARRQPLAMRGSYALVIRVQAKISVVVGSLGSFSLEPGHYLYVGSAKRGLSARLARHVRRRKRRRWHIDYLVTPRGVRVLGALVAPAYRECELHRALRQAEGCISVVPGFGASDCVFGCGSHLLRLTENSRLLGEVVHAADGR